jgi:hypothetical protein
VSTHNVCEVSCKGARAWTGVLKTGGLVMGMVITRTPAGLNIDLQHNPDKFHWDGCDDMFHYHLDTQCDRVDDAIISDVEKEDVKRVLRAELVRVAHSSSYVHAGCI